MSTPRLEDIQPIIDPLKEQIVRIMRSAWQDWLKSSYSGKWRCKRSRANFVWEQIIDRAHQAFSSHPAVHILQGHETYQFLIEDRVLFRFKKGDEQGLTANIPTQHAMAFHDHEVDLFGLPSIQRVDIVYRLNRLETDIMDFLVVARNGDDLMWSYSLIDQQDSIVTLPPTPTSPPDSPQPRTVHVRRDAANKRQAGKQGD